MMPGRGEEVPLAAGGPVRHVPVLRQEVLAALAPLDGGSYLDATFGAGGYARALLALPRLRLLALDRDPIAIDRGQELVKEAAGRLCLVKARFSEMEDVARAHGFSRLDGVVLDIGVSSMQLDEGARGFSFRHDGPLDMRMEPRGTTAAELVNTAAEATLANIFYYFGEEKASRRIARAIVLSRAKTPFVSTQELASLVAGVARNKPGDIHPATRVFQALRIAVNDELVELVHGLAAAERILVAGGRLAVVTFHSLEDRIVKQFFAGRSAKTRSRLLPHEAKAPDATFAAPGKQPVTPSLREIEDNPRARSAKLRYGIRTQAVARGIDPSLASLARIPESAVGTR